MDWRDAAETVGKAAPMLGGLLYGQAGAGVGRLIAGALGVEDDPAKVQAAMQDDPNAALKVQRLQQEHERELMTLALEAETSRLAEVNKTMRAEAGAEDAYVRRWRPTFGYMVALAWALQSIAIGWTIVATPEQAGVVAQTITALTPMWAVALSILGINVHKRSQDKQVAAGQKPSTFLDAIKRR